MTTDGAVAASSSADKNITSTLQTAVTTGHASQWLVLIRPQGVMEVRPSVYLGVERFMTLLDQIWSLPKLTLVFSSVAISTLESVLSDSFDPPALSPPQDPPRKPQDLDIEQILIAPLGESAPTPHLFVCPSPFYWFHRLIDLTGIHALWTLGGLRSSFRSLIHASARRAFHLFEDRLRKSLDSGI